MIRYSDDEPKFVDSVDFDDWMDKNDDLIHKMYRTDIGELLFEAYMAGYSHGLDVMVNHI